MQLTLTYSSPVVHDTELPPDVTKFSDYEALRALDSDNVPTTPSMTEEEINALPVHKYKVSGSQNGSSTQQASSSTLGEKKQNSSNAVGGMKASDDELTCSVCLEQVNVGDILRSLPCLHQFHANCIDPWLRQQGTCPVCKFRAGSGWHETGQDANDEEMQDLMEEFQDDDAFGF